MRCFTFRRFTALVLFVSALWSPGYSAESASAWRGVTRVRGTYTITNESWDRNEPKSNSYQKETAVMNFVLSWDEKAIPSAPPGFPPELLEMLQRSGSPAAAAAAKAAAEAAKIAPGPPALFFRGESAQIVGSVRSESSLKEFSRDKGWVVVSSSTGEANFSGEPLNVKEGFDFMIYPGTGAWEISLPKEMREEYTLRVSTYNRNDGARNHEYRKRSVLDHSFRGKVSGTLAPITASYAREDINKSDPKRGSLKTAQLQLWPEAQDVALELTIPGYDQWRPKGTVDIDRLFEPGNHLIVRATLAPKGGRVEDLPAIASMKFALLDTSREPGICLNWPLEMETDDLFDLKLDELPQFPGFLDNHKQTNELKKTAKDAAGRPYGESRINSFDFGGRATLVVTCVLGDGRQLIGTLKTQAGEVSSVRLPQMKKAGWIADSWRQQNNVAGLAEEDDDEKVEGQKDNGDGYTLYEEYRGWVVNGRHVEGDPKRKDFFVLNLVGAHAALGIELFEQVSELRVHSKLRPTEMSEEKRLMNGNRRDAPQRVKQHGVWVKTFPSLATLGGPGAFTPMTKAGVSGRPGITIGIGLLARNNPDSAFNKPYNLPQGVASVAYDRAIAHELLHSVGVEHHGEADRTLSPKWVSPHNPRNKRGRPYFRELATFSPAAGDTILTILDENGNDLAPQLMSDYAKDRETHKRSHWDRWMAEGRAYIAARPSYQLQLDTPEKYAENELEDMVGRAWHAAVLGQPGGEHSGAQDCLMRYYFAEFYPAPGRPDTYYLVTPGTEPFGLGLCRSKGGTGINAPSHQPRSRYGDAGPHGGNCFSQICPNDAIPPKSTQN